MYNLGLNEKKNRKKKLAGYVSILVFNTKNAFNRQLMAKRHLVSSFETRTFLPTNRLTISNLSFYDDSYRYRYLKAAVN